MTHAAIPSPSISAISIGPLTIHFYALFILAGIIVAWTWSSRRWLTRGGDAEQFFDIVFVTVIAGVIGARIYHVAVNLDDYFGPGADPWSAVRIWEGGLGIWGAVAFGALGALVMCKLRGANFLVLADSIAPTLFIAQAIGRLGNWANQELYGAPTDLPWGLRITCEQNGGVIAGCVPGVYQPTFLYEALWNIAACLLLIYLSQRFEWGGGRIFVGYIIGYGVGRILMETMRTDPATMVAGLRIHMLIYIATTVIAALVFAILTARARTRGEAFRATDDVKRA